MTTKPPSHYGLKEFENLNTSTRTFMVYSSVLFNLQKIFDLVPTTPIDIPLTKRKHVDRKNISAPDGAIVSIQKERFIRGVDIRKTKKHWCTSCRLMKTLEDKEIPINTVVEELKHVKDDKYEITYYCNNCKKYYTSSDLGKIATFLNQVTITVSVNGILLNIMVFKDSFKVAGCKHDEDAEAVTRILWERYLRKEPGVYSLKEGETHPRFIFRRVMRNVQFNLGFAIDLNKLNTLMNKEEYAKYVDVAQRETTGHPNVNIAMYSNKPEDYKYDMLVYGTNSAVGKGKMTTIDDNPYQKKQKKTHTTFIVFSSSQVILSGRYQNEMKTLYNFFVQEVMEHSDYLKEKLKTVDRSFLKMMEVKS